MKNSGKIVSIALLASAAAIAPAAAEGVFSGTVALTSNYLFRGITQTSGNPAIQGSFDYTNGIFYAGVWGSNVDFGGDETLETDVYVGVRPTAGPVTFDLGVIGYYYPGAADDGAELDYYEGKLAASISPVEGLSVGAAAYYSPEFTGETGEALYLELNAAYAFADAFSVSGGFGNQDIDDSGDYDTWNLGAAYAISGFKFDLRYVDTDISGLDEEVVLTISRSL
jgi:uncharacterized protein (TIGR02001 family)